jgi:muramoyltetrapeptide carboxypeptidase
MMTLKSGECIGLVAPAGYVKVDEIKMGLNLLEEQGYCLKYGKNLFNRYRYYSGKIAERLEDIHHFLNDPEVRMLFAVRGGSGSSQLLPYLDYKLWKKSGKILVGFSDITALHWALWSKCQLNSFSGMALTLQFTHKNPYLKTFFKQLSGQKKQWRESDFPGNTLKIVQEGKAEGVLLGGTLSIIVSLLGTPYFPQSERIILFIEDVNEPLYKIERSLVHLKNSGLMERIKGVILGRFKYNNYYLRVWHPLKYLFPEQIPIVANFPYGHFQRACALPLGIEAKMETNPFNLKWS